MIEVGALLVDLDGVLVDSTAAVERHWRRFASWYQLDVDRVLEQIHGRRTIDTIDTLLAPHSDAVRRAAYRRLQELEIEEREGVDALPGAAKLLEALPDDSVAVVTSGSRPVAVGRLRAAALPVPRVLVTGDDIRRGKPDPEGYRAAARMLLVDPARALVVEDAPPSLEAGRRAGARLLALTTTHDAAALEPLLRPDDLLVPDLGHVRIGQSPRGTVVRPTRGAERSGLR